MFKKLLLLLAIILTFLLAKPTTVGEWETTIENNETVVSLVKRGNSSFNLHFDKEEEFTDVNISVEFKANSGKIDQGGGLMWRVQDSDNYYVARFNPLEDNFRFYLVHSGIRTELASADVTLSKGWHTMQITHIGGAFKGYLDGKNYLEFSDKKLLKAGGIGLWTKADALTSFRHLKFEEVK